MLSALPVLLLSIAKITALARPLLTLHHRYPSTVIEHPNASWLQSSDH